MAARMALTKTVIGLMTAFALVAEATAEVRQGNAQIASIAPVKSSIHRNGDSATMIVLFSYKRIQTGYVGNADRPKAFYYNATRSSFEFDCREHRSRIVSTIFFSDRMGRGNVVHQQTVPGGWMHDDDFGSKESLSFLACQSPLSP